MFTKTYNVQFDGYFLESDINSLPAKSGIYGIYTCIHNRNDTVTLERLIYIGESHNVRQRVENHIKWSSWKRRLKKGEKLCFNVALIYPKRDRKRVEAALIYKHQPAGNTEHVDEPPPGITTIKTSGKNYFMETWFTVRNFRTNFSN